MHVETSNFIDDNFSYGTTPTISKLTRVTHSTATLNDNIYASYNMFYGFKSNVCVGDLSDHFPILVIEQLSEVSVKRSR